MSGLSVNRALDNYAEAYEDRYGVPPKRYSSELFKVSDKLHDFLMNGQSRPDLQTPEAQRFLDTLHNAFWSEKTDPLMPWMVREWKKNRIYHSPDPYTDRGVLHLYPQGDFQVEGRLTPDRLNHWADWYRSGHPTARGDIMQKKLPDVMEGVKQWTHEMEEQARAKALASGEVTHQYPNGWTLRQLKDDEALKAEGDAMGNCVGGYGNQVAKGRSLIYSLRDEKGFPHVTMELEPTQHGDPDPEWLERGMEANPVTRALPEQHKDSLREYHERKLNNPNKDLSPYPLPEHLTEVQGLYNQLEREFAKPVPQAENANVIQIKGRANQDPPKDEYKTYLKQWFHTFPPETRPTHNDYDEGDGMYDGEGYWHSDIDHPDLIPEYEEEKGGLVPQNGPTEDDYGLIHHTTPMDADYDKLLDNIKFNSYGYYDTPNGQHLDDIWRLAEARSEVPKLEEALEPYSQHQQENFDDWMNLNYQYAPRYPDEPHGYENEDGEEVGEGEGRPYWMPEGSEGERYYSEDDAEKAYYDSLNEWENQHPGMAASSDLWKRIQAWRERQKANPQAPAFT